MGNIYSGQITLFRVALTRPMRIPRVEYRVRAGFPAIADDYVAGRLSLDELLIEDLNATFFVEVAGDSMVQEGIYPGSILVVEKRPDARHGDVVLALLDDEFTVKTYWSRDGIVKLMPANPAYPPIIPRDGQELQIWGIVIATVRQLRTSRKPKK